MSRTTTPRPRSVSTPSAPAAAASRRTRSESISADVGAGIGPNRSTSPSSSLVELGLVHARGELLVAAQAQTLVAHVLGREERRDRERDRDLRGRLHDRLALQRRHGIGEQMVVQLESHRGDLAVLLLAEQVAGAANLEVAHRQLESGAEVLQVADDVESLVGLLGQRPRGRIHHVRVGALPRAADATAQLVQLREPESVRVVDDDGVGVGNVETRTR